VPNLGSHSPVEENAGNRRKKEDYTEEFPCIKNSGYVGAHSAFTAQDQEIGNAIPSFYNIVAFL